MRSGRGVDFVAPGVEDWLTIDVFDEDQKALLEFVFRGEVASKPAIWRRSLTPATPVRNR
jgi:hypothetical protein